MAPNPFVWGDFEYTYGNGYTLRAPGGYNTLTDTYHVRGAHGSVDPWQHGANMATHLGFACVEMLFVPEHTNDPRMPGIIELYYDRHGIWLFHMLPLLNRLAPVNMRELQGKRVCPVESFYQADNG